jgi:hypothetical protein
MEFFQKRNEMDSQANRDDAIFAKQYNYKVFEIHSASIKQYMTTTYYFASNIIEILSNSNEKRDNDLQLPKDTIDDINLCLDSEHYRRRHSNKTKTLYHLTGFEDSTKFVFVFKNHIMHFQINTFGRKPHGVEGKLFYLFKIYYEDYKVLQDLIKSTKLHYQKYINDGEIDEENTIDCYINDEDGYWDLGTTRKKRNLDTIYLPKKDKERILNKVKQFNSAETIDRYHRCGVLHKMVCLLHGVPGGGKTSFVTAIASELNYDIASFTFDPKTTDSKLNKLISNLPDKTILVLEDMDCLFKDRKENDGHKNAITLSGILNVLDGLNSKEGMIVFITTNHKEFLYDPALIRPGRVDISMKFENIKIPQVKEMYKVFMEKSFDETHMEKFINEFKKLNIECTTALLQQYLFIHMDNPQSAIDNIYDMEDLYKDAQFSEKKDNLYT